jgi:hypothetical protein
MKYPYLLEKPIYGTSIGVSVHANWRKLPPLLHEIKRLDLSIHKAKYWDHWTTMYLAFPKIVGAPRYIDFEDILKGVDETDNSPLYTPGLPFNTTLYMYNISTAPYTVVDFACIDRPGLFCEILELLQRYDIEVNGAYINTIGSVVSNIFYISRNGRKLDDNYIAFIKNNMEFDIRHRGADSY